jgi:hypothetical protein
MVRAISVPADQDLRYFRGDAEVGLAARRRITNFFVTSKNVNKREFATRRTPAADASVHGVNHARIELQ